MAITAREARKNLFPLIEQVNRDHSTVRITSKAGDAVLMSADDYDSWQQTVYLLRSPENARRLMEAVSRDKAATPDGVLDAGYAHLAAEFNSEPANAERRAARSRYAALAQEYDDFYGEGAQAPMSDVTAHLFRSPENARRLLDAAAALDRRLTATATWLEELPESAEGGATHQQALDALDAAVRTELPIPVPGFASAPTVPPVALMRFPCGIPLPLLRFRFWPHCSRPR